MMSPSLPPDLVAEIDAHVAARMEAGHWPGLALGIEYRGRRTVPGLQPRGRRRPGANRRRHGLPDWLVQQALHSTAHPQAPARSSPAERRDETEEVPLGEPLVARARLSEMIEARSAGRSRTPPSHSRSNGRPPPSRPKLRHERLLRRSPDSSNYPHCPRDCRR